MKHVIIVCGAILKITITNNAGESFVYHLFGTSEVSKDGDYEMPRPCLDWTSTLRTEQMARYTGGPNSYESHFNPV